MTNINGTVVIPKEYNNNNALNYYEHLICILYVNFQ